ncbi:hypothetical protein YTPLAS18_15780 [Nitrospira sp.]|nr:hypothetical protein YTPLAS18_15780 [Nitrospira sp.]
MPQVPRHFLVSTILVVSVALSPPAVGPDEATAGKPPEESEQYYAVPRLNAGLAELKSPISLQTPQQTLRHFITSSRRGDFAAAGRTLNLNEFTSDDQNRLAPYLAEQFYYVLGKRPWIDWQNVPDREDGALEAEKQGANGPSVGQVRRSIRVASVPYDQWSIEVRLERFKTPDHAPVWLFSPHTVAQITKLYEIYGPGPLVYTLPPEVRVRLVEGDPRWQAGVLLVILLLATSVGWLARRLLAAVAARWGGKDRHGLLDGLLTPVGVLVAVLVVYYVAALRLSLSGPLFAAVGPLVSIAAIASVTWLGIRTVGYLADKFTQPYLDTIAREEQSAARRTMTQISVARRMMILLAVIGAIGVALEQVNFLDTWSASLLASAGIVSVLVGVAAHNVLGNVFAGIQIALTQPARIGDTVLFEGHWGYVEDITYTYVAIRRWDAKRLIVPVSYFIAHPFENWSMKEAHVLTTVYLYLDYGIDLDALRHETARVISSSEFWDRVTPPTVQVTSLKENCMEVRVLSSAKDGPTAWELQCHLRESLITYVTKLEQGRYLPRFRAAVGTAQDGMAKLDVESRHGG